MKTDRNIENVGIFKINSVLELPVTRNIDKFRSSSSASNKQTDRFSRHSRSLNSSPPVCEITRERTKSFVNRVVVAICYIPRGYNSDLQVSNNR